MTRVQNTRQNHYIKISNKYFERVKIFNYLGTTLTNKISVHEEIKGRMTSGRACHHPVQNPLSFSWLSKYVRIKIYRTIILPVVLYGFETRSLIEGET
jgi:hypothetical protein